MFFTIEVKTKGNYPSKPTQILGINSDFIKGIKKVGVNGIFFTCIRGNYDKSFQTQEERDAYFDYVASKLEVLELPKITCFQKQGDKSCAL